MSIFHVLYYTNSTESRSASHIYTLKINRTKLKETNFFMWDSCVINCVGRAVIGWSSNPMFFLKYFVLSMCSLNCLHTLQRRLVAYSHFYRIIESFLPWRVLKIFLCSFHPLLYFTNLGTGEEFVFFILLSFFALLKEEVQAKFASFSLVFPVFPTHHFYASTILYNFFWSTVLREAHVK